MSKTRNKDDGKYSAQSALSDHPVVERLDLTNPATRPASANFRRTELGQNAGRARQHMNADSQGPTVPPYPPYRD
jgi:hypothetical protein